VGLAEQIAQAREAGRPELLADLVPYARFLGLTAELREGELLACMRYSDRLIGNPALPALHGGALGGLLESTAVFHLLWTTGGAALPKVINLSVEYLRSAAAVDTWARATVGRLGRRVALLRVEAWQQSEDVPVATATVHLKLGAP
jgi:uncharacterized protein (TIGR00369 family)